MKNKKISSKIHSINTMKCKEINKINTIKIFTSE